MSNYKLHYEEIRKTLEELWSISTDSSITEENKVKIIRDVSRAALDKEPTTADLLRDPTLADKDNNRFNDKEWSIKDEEVEGVFMYDDEEDVQLAYSIVRSNDQEGEITQIDYIKEK